MKFFVLKPKAADRKTDGSNRFGNPFTRLQCQKHTDAAFACLPRMMARYKPRYVGMVLPDDDFHQESINEILPAIKKLGAGAWLVGEDGIITLNDPTES